MKSEINVDDDQSGCPIPLGIGSSEAEPAGVNHQTPLSQYGKVHGGSALGESFHILNSSGHGQVNCGHDTSPGEFCETFENESHLQ